MATTELEPHTPPNKIKEELEPDMSSHVTSSPDII